MLSDPLLALLRAACVSRVGIFGRPFVKRFALCYQTVVCLSALSVTLVYCGETVGRINMKLGKQVGLGPGHNVLDGDPVPQRDTAPNFRPYLLRPNGCMDQDVTWYGARPHPRRLCVRWGPAPILPKRGSPLPNFRPISIVAKRLDASRCQLVWM